ncbi:peptidoglycan-binding protein LysM [Moraxella caviae]|uniref:Potassium binding protein Kbp n=1 Tax=Moraxella caviae TaxID=34060 RepID=A0A1S9ZY01_9GAMM|nr:peptidoglycan-binding protein LysM [Moraxella caviae]OOR88278.1 peptidoglycan-binding protein LysM [Moraxella caviae]STZ13887.1 LysM domain/BON superfamily protein [Moraxella caviae]
MGIFSFAKDIGDKIFNRDKKEAAPAATPDAAPSEPSAQEIANLLLARVQAQNVQIDGLKVSYNGDTDTVTLSGTAKTQADRERARLAVGNVQHVETVVDNLEVQEAAEESRFYTVKSGDNLSKIAKEMYGNANDYMKIFDANKPMLSDPDKIYVGQVLRIPA